MKKITMLLLLITLPICLMSMNAEEQWRHIEGLPCEETSSITQDINGFLWFGTRLGIIRYDGYKVQVYKNDIMHPHAFSSCDIKCLATDSCGSIFAGSFYGLHTISSFTHEIDICHFQENDYVQAICYDHAGRQWIGTYYGLYVRQDNAQPSLNRQIPEGLVQKICEAPDHHIWVASQHNGIFVGDSHLFHAIAGTDMLTISTMAIDTEGVVWVGTDKMGLFSITNGELTHHPGFEGHKISSILVSRQQYRFLVGTDSGLFSCELGSPQMEYLKGFSVEDIFEDRDGNLWAATNGRGIWFLRNQPNIIKVEKRDFTHKTHPLMSQFQVRHLADSALWKTMTNINGLYEKTDGTTYIGTGNNGFYIIKDGKIMRHVTKQSDPWLQSNDIYSFTEMGNGRMLFTSWYGIYLYDPATNDGQMVDSIGSTFVGNMHTLSILHSSPNDLWFGIVGGIAHAVIKDDDLTHADFTLYTHVNVPGISQPDNVGNLADKHDETGEYQLGGIFRILRNRQGHIWACTSEPELLLYDRQADVFRAVSHELGIPGDNVHSMDIDNFGNYWLSTNHGILEMTIDKDGQAVAQQLYTKKDGLPANYFGSTMSSLLADGSIAFLNQDYLITVIPSAEKSSKTSRHTAVIADMLVNGVPLRHVLHISEVLPPLLDHVTLQHDQNNLSISFSTLSYGEEASIRYYYKLSGIDNDYLLTETGSNSVNYSQIPPGTYLLHYGVTDHIRDGDKYDQTLKITILQPIWWRWWAKMIYVILIALIAYITIHSAVDRNRKRHQLEILAVEKHSLDEQYRKMTQFYVKVIHTFLTPVTLMSEQIRELQKKVRPSLQASLFMLSAQTKQLQDSMNDIIEVKDDNSIREAMQKAQEMTQTDRDFLRRCTESVNLHIGDFDYTHQTMMSDVGASHATLYRKLKALTGMDATSFIRSIRMKAACQILTQEPNIRINELAERVGYNNPKYFSTCFKAEFGMSPRDYQSSLHN